MHVTTSMLVNNRKRAALERNRKVSHQGQTQMEKNLQCDNNNLLRIHVVHRGSAHSSDCVR